MTGSTARFPSGPTRHGYGAALPGAAHAKAVDLTFLAADGGVLGSQHVIAPVG